MSLEEIRKQFAANQIAKPEYIDRMHEVHACLFEYAGYIGQTDISKIEITDGMVVMTSREDSVKILCDPDDKRIAPIEILNFMDYEKVDSRMVFRLVHDGDRILDVGANIGWYSISLAKRYPNCTIQAFEPIPKTFGYLAKNVGLNGVANIRLNNFGFSNTAAELTFYYYATGSGNASSAKLADLAGVQEIKCRVMPMDDFLREQVDSIDFIKCDVEGAELMVFQGGMNSLRAHKPVVFSEMLRKWSAKFGYHPNEILELFAGLGYRCFAARGDRLVEFMTITDETIETNFFFLHREKHARQIQSLADET
ncbi:MAG: FkbM family methyltransferase [Candidatus Wallbacteria bacterium]|nr:FkbM family methyltransferase [Candidatus Wallbacteria bacterium]